MFNIGFSELLFICAIALIFIGPKQLPEVARTLGKFLNELRRASDEALQIFKETQIKSEKFIRKTEEEINLNILDIAETKIANIDLSGDPSKDKSLEKTTNKNNGITEKTKEEKS